MCVLFSPTCCELAFCLFVSLFVFVCLLFGCRCLFRVHISCLFVSLCLMFVYLFSFLGVCLSSLAAFARLCIALTVIKRVRSIVISLGCSGFRDFNFVPPCQSVSLCHKGKHQCNNVQ